MESLYVIKGINCCTFFSNAISFEASVVPEGKVTDVDPTMILLALGFNVPKQSSRLLISASV